MDPVAAAVRIKGLLEEAKEHGHYTNGWYAYLARWDVEACVDAVLRFADVDERGQARVGNQDDAEGIRADGSPDVARQLAPQVPATFEQLELSVPPLPPFLQ